MLSTAITKPAPTIRKIAAFSEINDFKAYLQQLGLDNYLPCDNHIITNDNSSLAAKYSVFGKTATNRICIHPMEGWDATPEGGVSDLLRRRWQRFGQSGAKLIFGGEAMAVRMDGRSSPEQLAILPHTAKDLAQLRLDCIKSHEELYGRSDDLIIGFQLTHSGRWSKPNDRKRYESLIAYRHPLLDKRSKIDSAAAVVSDDFVKNLVDDYAQAAAIAYDCGADFVDIKHCHGYLLHEFLSAYTRPGDYGGDFENRTRLFREIVTAIKAKVPQIGLAMRISAFDSVPFCPDPETSTVTKKGAGIPEDYSNLLPYKYGFGLQQTNPLEIDLAETFKFIELAASLGVEMINVSGGSPYYCPHVQRPACFPVSDGYQAPEDPLRGVARLVSAAAEIKAKFPSLCIIASGLSYLQEYLPQVSQALLTRGDCDFVGLGRAVLSYPQMLRDALDGKTLNKRFICRTFGDCTSAPRNGLVSGCYPLDHFYKEREEFSQLQKIKQGKAPQA